MNAYVVLTVEKRKYISDNRDIYIGAMIALVVAYLILSRPDAPKRYTYTWSDLLVTYGIAIYIGASFVAGWKLLHGLTSQYFIALPLVGWVIYFFLKVALALFIGGSCFYGPIRLGTNTYHIHRINKQLRALEHRENPRAAS